MNILKRGTIEICSEKYPKARQALFVWYKEVKQEKWDSPNDIKKKYPKASIIGDNRVVFDIVGGSYRLIVKVKYGFGQVYIVFFGTHQEYDKVNAETVVIFN